MDNSYSGRDRLIQTLQGINKTHGIVGRPSDGRVGLE